MRMRIQSPDKIEDGVLGTRTPQALVMGDSTMRMGSQSPNKVEDGILGTRTPQAL
jgi:hypothetical protein